MDEKKALLTRADLIGYIWVPGDDCLATSHDTYDSSIAQLRIVDQGVEFVTEGIGPLHRVEDRCIVAPDLGDGSGGDESSARDDYRVPMEETT